MDDKRSKASQAQVGAKRKGDTRPFPDSIIDVELSEDSLDDRFSNVNNTS